MDIDNNLFVQLIDYVREDKVETLDIATYLRGEDMRKEAFCGELYLGSLSSSQYRDVIAAIEDTKTLKVVVMPSLNFTDEREKFDAAAARLKMLLTQNKKVSIKAEISLNFNHSPNELYSHVFEPKNDDQGHRVEYKYIDDSNVPGNFGTVFDSETYDRDEGSSQEQDVTNSQAKKGLRAKTM